MRATKISQLVVIAAILVAIGFALSQILMGQTARSLPVPAMAAGALWILGECKSDCGQDRSDYHKL